MPSHKFGIELEVSGISPQTATDALTLVGINAVNESYNHRTRTYWKVTTDSSIQSDNGLACEVVSPILSTGRGEETIKTIKKVVTALINAGATVNDSCGFHVHVNCRNISNPDFFRVLLALYARCEDEIDLFVPESRRASANRFCQSNKSLLETWERFWSDYVSPSYGSARLLNVFTDVPRYHKLNFNSYVRHGTVEFRQLQGTLDFEKITSWIAFCISLVDRAQNFITNNPPPENSIVLRDRAVPAISPKFYLTRMNYESNKTCDIDQAFKEIGGMKTINDWFSSSIDNDIINQNVKNAIFTSQETNKVFKALISLVYHYAVNHDSINREIEFGDRVDDGFRERTFSFRSAKQKNELIDLVTASFFGFNGTDEEIHRKVNAKLTNIGIPRNRDGSIIIQGDGYGYITEVSMNTNRSPYDHHFSNKGDYNFLYQTGFPSMKSERCYNLKILLQKFAKVGNAYNAIDPRTTNYIRDGLHTSEPTNLTAEMFALAIGARAIIQNVGMEDGRRSDYNFEDTRENMRRWRGVQARINDNFHDRRNLFCNNGVLFKSVHGAEPKFTKIEKDYYLDAAEKLRESPEIQNVFELMDSCCSNSDNHPREEMPSISELRGDAVSTRTINIPVSIPVSIQEAPMPSVPRTTNFQWYNTNTTSGTTTGTAATSWANNIVATYTNRF